MLIRLQKTYPPNKIINELLSLFEILQAYEADGSKLTAEERKTVSDSCENILRELAGIADTLKLILILKLNISQKKIVKKSMIF